MPDTYGGISIPIAPPIAGVEITDPATTILAQFALAVLNAYGQAAYSAIKPSVTGLATGTGTLAHPVCKTAHAREPSEEEFNEKELPCVYVWRQGADKDYWLAEDYRIEESTWTLLYLFEPEPQAGRSLLKSFANGVAKILDNRIEAMRDPNYVASFDTDPLASAIAPNPTYLLAPVASSLTEQIYTPPQVQGAVLAVPQLPTVTVTGAPLSGTVNVTGVGPDGISPRMSRIVLSGIGTFVGDHALKQVTEVDVPAQATTAATLNVGLYGSPTAGSNILLLGGLMKLEIEKWKQYRWTLKMGDTSPARSYPHAVEITLKVQERMIRDISSAAASSIDIQFPTAGTDNSSVREETILS
jgi:hypothetical protein